VVSKPWDARVIYHRGGLGFAVEYMPEVSPEWLRKLAAMMEELADITIRISAEELRDLA